MNGLNLQQEAALAIAWIHQNNGMNNFTNLGLSNAFVSFRDMGMLKIATDMGGELVIFQGMEVNGLDHYNQARKARRRFEAVSDAADILLFVLAVQDAEKRIKPDADLQVLGDLAAVPLYQELSRHDLLNVTWADDSPYIVQVTDKAVIMRKDGSKIRRTTMHRVSPSRRRLTTMNQMPLLPQPFRM